MLSRLYPEAFSCLQQHSFYHFPSLMAPASVMSNRGLGRLSYALTQNLIVLDNESITFGETRVSVPTGLALLQLAQPKTVQLKVLIDQENIQMFHDVLEYCGTVTKLDVVNVDIFDSLNMFQTYLEELTISTNLLGYYNLGNLKIGVVNYEETFAEQNGIPPLNFILQFKAKEINATLHTLQCFPFCCATMVNRQVEKLNIKTDFLYEDKSFFLVLSMVLPHLKEFNVDLDNIFFARSFRNEFKELVLDQTFKEDFVEHGFTFNLKAQIGFGLDVFCFKDHANIQEYMEIPMEEIVLHISAKDVKIKDEETFGFKMEGIEMYVKFEVIYDDTYEDGGGWDEWLAEQLFIQEQQEAQRTLEQQLQDAEGGLKQQQKADGAHEEQDQNDAEAFGLFTVFGEHKPEGNFGEEPNNGKETLEEQQQGTS